MDLWDKTCNHHWPYHLLALEPLTDVSLWYALFEHSYNWHHAYQTTLLLCDSLSLSRSFLLWLQPWSLSTIMLIWHSFLIIIIIIITSRVRIRVGRRQHRYGRRLTAPRHVVGCHLANNSIKSPTEHAIRKCASSPNSWGTGGGWGLGWKWAPIGGLQYRTHMQAPKYDVQFLRSEALRSSSSSSSRTRQIKEC